MDNHLITLIDEFFDDFKPKEESEYFYKLNCIVIRPDVIWKILERIKNCIDEDI